MRKLVLGAVFAAAALLGFAVQAEEFKVGEHYVELRQPVPTANPDKIEVVEMFWYGCRHCYQFEPTINPWVEKLPKDVDFRRVPALFGGAWNLHGQFFLALEAMGVEPKVHEAIFTAIHREHQGLTSPEEMAAFLADHGVDPEQFLKAFNSFGVKSAMEKAKRLGMAYQVTGVPTLIVNGKYRFSVSTAGSPERALQLADELIAKERAAR